MIAVMKKEKSLTPLLEAFEKSVYSMTNLIDSWPRSEELLPERYKRCRTRDMFTLGMSVPRVCGKTTLLERIAKKHYEDWAIFYASKHVNMIPKEYNFLSGPRNTRNTLTRGYNHRNLLGLFSRKTKILVIGDEPPSVNEMCVHLDELQKLTDYPVAYVFLETQC